MEVTNIEVKKFKVGEVVSSPNGVGNVLNINDDRRDLYPVQVIYADGRTISYTRDGRPHADYELVSLFHGEGTVEYKMVFAPKQEPKPELVYEYQWLIKFDGCLVGTTRYHTTEQEARKKYHGYEVQFLERLDKYKREATKN